MISRRLWWITECLFCLWWFKAEKNDVNFWNSYNVNVHSSFFYIQSFHMTEYSSPERALSVRVCVCLSQPFIWKLYGRFWWNLDHMILSKIWDDTFFKFLICCFDDVIAAILYVFECGTLTVAILLWFSSKLQTRKFDVFQCLLLKISKIGW